MKIRFNALIVLAVTGLIWYGCTARKSIDDLRADGKKLFAEEKYADARAVFAKGLQINPSDRELMYLTGLAYRRDQIYDSALSCLRRVSLLYPNDREVNQALYEVAMALNDWPVARSALRGLIDVGAAPPKHWKLMADLWRRSDSPINCLYFTRKAILDDPEDMDLWLQVANAAAACDSAAEALRYMDSAIARFGPNDMLVANRATFLTFLKQYDSAEVVMRSLLAKDTGSVQFKLNLAHVLSSGKSVDKKREALALYKLVQPKIGSEFKVDSLIEALEKELK